ncbi:hypothetical protein ACP70R_025417 [Stipagrostis hirtigluma subsp. patula]
MGRGFNPVHPLNPLPFRTIASPRPILGRRRRRRILPWATRLSTPHPWSSRRRRIVGQVIAAAHRREEASRPPIHEAPGAMAEPPRVSFRDGRFSSRKAEEADSDPCIAAMAERMKAKFSKYWEDKKDLNTLLFIAIILDPRCKLKYLRFTFSNIYYPAKAKEFTDKIESDVHRLFDYYVKSYASASCHNNFSQPALFIDVDEHEEDPSMLLASQFSMHLEEIETRESNSELSRYLAENCEKMSEKIDLLAWWKCNSNKYPILSTFAKDVLAVPVSTVASESAFSTGGRVIDSFRTSLSANMVEALICTQSWLRSPSGIVDIRKAMELEAYEEVEQAFGQGLGHVTLIIIAEMVQCDFE